VAVTPADLEAIKQAIIGAINSAAGTASGGATVGDPAEIARLEAYVETLNRASAALSRQEDRANAMNDVRRREEELSRIATERQQNLIEGYETEIALNNQRGTATASATAAIEQQIDAAEREIEATQESTRQREENTAAAERNQAAVSGISSSVQRLTQAYGQHNLINVENIQSMVSQIRQAGFLKTAQGALGGVLKGLVNTMIQLAFMTDESSKSFMAATGASRETADAIMGDVQAMSFYGVQVNEVYAAHTALRGEMTEFSMMSTENQRAVANTGALLQKQGVSLTDFGKATQTAMKAFSMGAREAAGASVELNDLAQKIGVTPQQMQADFASAGNELSAFGSSGVRAFKDLAIVSKSTGLEMDKLLRISEGFDTFEGAATQAGKLNAALGGNFVNAMDLMMAKEPAKRFQQIRDAVLSTGKVFDEMDYFEKKFYVGAIDGIETTTDLALLMSGDLDKLKDSATETTASIKKLQERTKAIQSIQERFKSLMMSLIPVVEPLIKMFEDLAKKLENNKAAIQTFTGGIKALMEVFVALIPHLDKIVYGFLAVGFIKLAAGMLVWAKTMGFIGKTAPPAAVGMSSLVGPTIAFGAAALLAGVGIGIAANGLSNLAESFSLLTPEQFTGLNEAIGGLLFTMIIFSVALLGVAKASAAAAGPLLAFGAAVLGIGLGIAVAAAGIGEMTGGFSAMFDSITAENVGLFTTFATTMALGSTAFAAAGVGLGVMGLGISSVGRALAGLPMETLKELSKLGGIDVNVETSGVTKNIKAIMESINKADTLKLAAASLLVTSATANNVGSRPAAASAAMTQQAAPSVDVKVYIDGSEMTQKAVVAVNDQITSRITGRNKIQ
jgi:hypothetical protein